VEGENHQLKSVSRDLGLALNWIQQPTPFLSASHDLKQSRPKHGLGKIVEPLNGKGEVFCKREREREREGERERERERERELQQTDR
jgi:hypothetical protein